ncbi:Regulatory-associated protein of mTOR [Trichinella pseudospiralis]|uniref:Regulatory-associated protein of mTOR n=1 Tax=Trichinella pseudospiralis TaxID=6337 RepID=A0A0V0XWX1_TRIPS|nr:Regulatory-associated protein of mTOR [Trichinella pseudospiralis]
MSEENDLHEEEPKRVPVSFADLRREQCETDNKIDPEFWRNRERMKTVSVALVLCLNIGIDPPDTVKPKPCARTECWIDPQCMPMQKALESIGTALQRQYQWWQPRARYKQALDPTVDDVRRLCISMRKNAKEERVLFHYNGHGVPRPTKNCEIWVFNKMFTQYIPLAIYDLQTWMGAPGVYVWDCNGAAQAIRAFKACAKKQVQAYRCSLAARRKESNKTTVEFEPGVDLFQADDARQAELGRSRRRKTGLDCVSSKPLEVNFRSSSAVPDDPKVETAYSKATAAKDASKHLAGNGSIGDKNVGNGRYKNDDGNNDGNTSNANDDDDDDDGDNDDDGEDDFDDDDPRKPKFKHCIQLAACARDQTLPTDPALPADLFTCCLTTPIRMAVMYYILQNKLTDRYPVCIADRIPGSTGDRRSPLGELNWIFTAITDTIAWNLLPSETFQRLFRQDLLIASLYRNYLLADRVMRSYYCTPVSSPRLPPTHEHVMWQAWDMVVESVLEQLDVQALVAEMCIRDSLSTCAQQFRSPMFYLLSESSAPSSSASNTAPPSSTQILPSFIADRISLIHQHGSIEWNLLSDRRKKYGKLWTYRNDFPATCVEFLPLEPLLCIGERDSVTVWNCNKGSVVAHFDNSSTSYTGQSGSDLSGNLVYLTFVNPYTHGFILTGTDCGEVRVWDVRLINEPDLTSKVPKGSIDFALLTAWMCADDARRFHTKPFTCYFWEQDPGLLFAAGDFRNVILWDAHTELKLAELKVGVGSDTYVCTLSADSNGHHLTAAGCSDGSVRLFDRRLPTSDCRIMTLRDLRRAVFKVHLEQASVGGAGGGRLVAASRSGQLCIWEPRMYREPVLFKDVGVRCLSSFDVHRTYPLIAVWNGAQVDLINFDGKSMGLIRPDVSSMTTALGRLTALRFHPVQVSIGLAEQDGQFSLYGLRP